METMIQEDAPVASSTATVPLKTCAKCGEAKPRDAEHFARDRTHPDGFKSRCKPCRNNGRPARGPRPVQRDPREEAKSRARAKALKQLVENHPQEYMRLVEMHFEIEGVQKRWHAVK